MGDQHLSAVAGRGRNFRISEEARLGRGGQKAKYTDNIAAIRVLRDLRENGRKVATPEEQAVLARYVGWGGLSQAFDPGNEKWAKEYKELKDLLPKEHYEKARRSTQDAHYTSEDVIKGIYAGMSRLGLQDGEARILEPSAGVGNFIGLCPEGLKADFTAVELDPTTAAIAGFLYPESTVINKGFQSVPVKDGAFDAVIGNPPFGKQTVFDASRQDLRSFSIHNYFIAKSMSAVKEGGVAAFVVSRYFLDAQDAKAREKIAESADFLGAVRLPGTAFKENAGTEVTTDIVFFQKNSREKKYPQEWIDTTGILIPDEKNRVHNPASGALEPGEKEAVVNAWFAARPEQVIGRLVYPKHGGMFGDTMTCEGAPDLDLPEELGRKIAAALPENVYVRGNAQAEEAGMEEAENEDFIRGDYFRGLKKDALCVLPESGKVVAKKDDGYGAYTYETVNTKTDAARQRIAGMVAVRDGLRGLLNAEKADLPEAELTRMRENLGRTYDAFVKKFGYLNLQTNKALFRNDPEASLLAALEVEYDKGLSADAAKKQKGAVALPASAKKADIFSRRVLTPPQAATKVDSVKDALLVSLRESGRVDFVRMGELLGRGLDEVRQELQDSSLIFQNPVNEAWEIADKYLTGNVRDKLEKAGIAAAADDRFQPNVEALIAVQPKPIEAVDIGVKLGTTWLPADVVEEFCDHLFDGNCHHDITFIPVIGKWEARIRSWDKARNESTWGIPEYPAADIVTALLTNKAIKVEKESGHFDERGRPVMVVDQELSTAANAKADEIKTAFSDWIWQDDDRRARLANMYNERFNTHVPPRYDGSHLEMPGASSNVTLRPHQKDVVWRAIQEGTGLFDHVVGAGKTMAAIATAMESKRMGFLQKPMIVVPNHLLYSWRDEVYRLYPDAKVLIAEKEDLKKENRQRFFGKVATGDWDAVVIAHSSFKMIEAPFDAQEEILQEEIDRVASAIQSGKEAGGERGYTVKQLEKAKDRMETRLHLLLKKAGEKDRGVDFADLGVDGLFVDESQEFKNLQYSTSLNVSGLGNPTGSGKAFDLFIKARYLQKKNDGRGLFFLTGTPISNTIAEVFTLQRYLQYEELQSKGIDTFDSWASTFGDIKNGWELDATGVNYTRLSKILLALFRLIISFISAYYLYYNISKSPMKSHVIYPFCGYSGGYLRILT